MFSSQLNFESFQNDFVDIKRVCIKLNFHYYFKKKNKKNEFKTIAMPSLIYSDEALFVRTNHIL